MSNTITKLDALRWLRDKAWALLASFWMFILLAGITGWLLNYLLQVDAEFVRSLAEFSTIPTATLLGLAYGMRIVTVVYGPAAIWNKMRGQSRRAQYFKIIGYSLALILLVHCMFIASKMMGDQLSQSSAIAEVEQTQTNGNTEQIAALNDMAETVRQDRDANVQEFRDAITNITSDGLDNDDEADAYRQSIVDEQNAARERLAEIDRQKLELLSASTQASTAARSAEATQRPYHDGFIVMARFITGKWDPAELPPQPTIYVCGIVFWLFWFGFIELLVMAFSTMAFGMLMLARARAEEADAQRLAASQAAEADTPVQPEPVPKKPRQPVDFGPAPSSKSSASRQGGHGSAISKKVSKLDRRIRVDDRDFDTPVARAAE